VYTGKRLSVDGSVCAYVYTYLSTRSFILTYMNTYIQYWRQIVGTSRCTQVRACLGKRVNVYIYTQCIYTYPCIYTYKYTCIHTYMHTYIYACLREQMCMSIHMQIYVHTCMHTYMYTYIHTYIHWQLVGYCRCSQNLWYNCTQKSLQKKKKIDVHTKCWAL